MTLRLMMAATALLASTSALAQAGPAEQTSQDLVCQLADSCEVGAAEEAEEAIETTPTVPGGRVSATRGFKIATRVSTPAAETTTQGSGSSTTKPKAKIATNPTKRATAPGKSTRPVTAMKNAGSGRADLRVSFVTGSAELTEFGQREAVKFAEALRSPLLSGMRFRIEGHTDAVGNRDYNLDLSRRRAQSVVDYLAGKGADRSRFDVLGYGFDKPLEGTAASSAANRRVEVVRIK